ncbi:MAG: superoxide dismutase family protein, partial [Phenylobacterium sp.]
HWDPARTAAHRGPHGDGHLADLPRIEAGPDGRAVATLIAPRITDVAALKGHAVIVHAGADTYSDTPDPLGGGGARLACGVLR